MNDLHLPQSTHRFSLCCFVRLITVVSILIAATNARVQAQEHASDSWISGIWQRLVFPAKVRARVLNNLGPDTLMPQTLLERQCIRAPYGAIHEQYEITDIGVDYDRQRNYSIVESFVYIHQTASDTVWLYYCRLYKQSIDYPERERKRDSLYILMVDKKEGCEHYLTKDNQIVARAGHSESPDCPLYWSIQARKKSLTPNTYWDDVVPIFNDDVVESAFGTYLSLPQHKDKYVFYNRVVLQPQMKTLMKELAASRRISEEKTHGLMRAFRRYFNLSPLKWQGNEVASIMSSSKDLVLLRPRNGFVYNNKCVGACVIDDSAHIPSRYSNAPSPDSEWLNSYARTLQNYNVASKLRDNMRATIRTYGTRVVRDDEEPRYRTLERRADRIDSALRSLEHAKNVYSAWMLDANEAADRMSVSLKLKPSTSPRISEGVYWTTGPDCVVSQADSFVVKGMTVLLSNTEGTAPAPNGDHRSPMSHNIQYQPANRLASIAARDSMSSYVKHVVCAGVIEAINQLRLCAKLDSELFDSSYVKLVSFVQDIATQYDKVTDSVTYASVDYKCYQKSSALFLYAEMIGRYPKMLERDEDDIIDSIEFHYRDQDAVLSLVDDTDYDDSVELYKSLHKEGRFQDLVNVAIIDEMVCEVDRALNNESISAIIHNYSTASTSYRDSLRSVADSIRRMPYPDVASRIFPEDTVVTLEYAPSTVDRLWPRSNIYGRTLQEMTAAFDDFATTRGYSNKYQPLPEGDLSSAIEHYPTLGTFTIADKGGIAVRNVGGRTEVGIVAMSEPNVLEGLEYLFNYGSAYGINVNVLFLDQWLEKNPNSAINSLLSKDHSGRYNVFYGEDEWRGVQDETLMLILRPHPLSNTAIVAVDGIYRLPTRK